MIVPHILEVAFLIIVASPFSIAAGSALASQHAEFSVGRALSRPLSLVWILCFGFLITWALEKYIINLFYGGHGQEPFLVVLLLLLFGWITAAALRIALIGIGFGIAKRKHTRKQRSEQGEDTNPPPLRS